MIPELFFIYYGCHSEQDAELDESFDVAVKTIPETDHDYIFLKLTVLQEVYETIGETHREWPL